MIVLDASAALELLLHTPLGARVQARIGRGPSLHAPSVLDLEVTQVIRRLCAAGRITAERGHQAVSDLSDFPVRRYPHAPLLLRIWALRGNLTAYDAAYVALAEALAAPLVTRDRRLASARGHRARVEVV